MTKPEMVSSGGPRGTLKPRRQVPDPEGVLVEGRALPEVVGMVEVAVLNANPLLQGAEEPLDPPARLVPAHRPAGGGWLMKTPTRHHAVMMA